MASQAQIDANRANAKSSTGPKTAAGKAASSQNSYRHGLLSKAPLYHSEEENNDYRKLEESLRAECQPRTAAEEQAFLRYAFNSYQIMRARHLEIVAMERRLSDPCELTIQVMDRTMKFASLLERRADRALNELRKLQKDRFMAHEIENEMRTTGQQAPIPVSLPVVEMAKSNLRQTKPIELAKMILANRPSVPEVPSDQTKPIEDPPLDFAMAA